MAMTRSSQTATNRTFALPGDPGPMMHQRRQRLPPLRRRWWPISASVATIPGYCNTILPQPFKNNAAWRAGKFEWFGGDDDLLNGVVCPLSGDASTRGDRMSPLNHFNYDSKVPENFVYLRDADGLEIQTRHTPVATTFNPSANPYTGLASCVSVNSAVAARVGKHRVTLEPSYGDNRQRNQLELRIDGKDHQSAHRRNRSWQWRTRP